MFVQETQSFSSFIRSWCGVCHKNCAVSVDEKISSTKYEIEKFTGVNDFGLRRLKMQALLVEQGLLEALKGPEKMDDALTDKNTKMIEKTHSAIKLSLGDMVLRQVSKEKIVTGVWSKLEGLYMTKSLVNRLYVKKALYSFKMSGEKVLAEQLNMLTKLILDLEISRSRLMMKIKRCCCCVL